METTEKGESLPWGDSAAKREETQKSAASAARQEETCRLLSETNALGVWGNHDYGLCVGPHKALRIKYPAAVMDFMASFRPRFAVDGCHFTHVEPWLNPEELTDLWYFDGPPDEPHKLDRIFRAVPHQIIFAGHFHKWLLAKPAGISQWWGDCPLVLDKFEGRYFVTVAALCDDRSAIFDTDTCVLVPHNELAREA